MQNLELLIQPTEKRFIPFFALGPMFSGKTELVQRIVKRRKRQGKRVVMIRSHIDTKSKPGCVTSHDDSSMEAIQVRNLAELDAVLANHDVFGVDEAHFYQDLVDFCKRMIVEKKEVYCSALNSSWEKKAFANVSDATALTTNVHFMDAVCMVCGETGIYNKRLVDDRSLILEGGKDIYCVTCVECFDLPTSVIRERLTEQEI